MVAFMSASHCGGVISISEYMLKLNVSETCGGVCAQGGRGRFPRYPLKRTAFCRCIATLFFLECIALICLLFFVQPQLIVLSLVGSTSSRDLLTKMRLNPQEEYAGIEC